MKFWLQLGLRSLLRNPRRSLLTAGVVALGYTAINLMGGFMHYVFQGLEESYVYTHGNAHLTVFKSGFREKGALDPGKYLIEGDALPGLMEACQDFPGTRIVTPQLQLSGLIHFNERSTIIFAQGIVPEDHRNMRAQAKGLAGDLSFFSGQPLTTSSSIGIARGLAKMLGAEIGSDVILMVQTQEGYMNAVDATVAQLHDAPVELLDQMYVVLPFSAAQELYQTGGADRVRVLLDSGAHLNRRATELEDHLQSLGYSVEVATWQELRVAYGRIRSMFDVLFSFVFTVVALIVALAIVNTVSANVIERTREIGTLRALGMSQKSVLRLFCIESGLLGLVGLTGGFIIFLTTRGLIQLLEPTWIPPNIPKRVPWEIAWAPGILIVSALCLLLLTLFAAAWPARRAGRTPIIEALGHV